MFFEKHMKSTNAKQVSYAAYGKTTVKRHKGVQQPALGLYTSTGLSLSDLFHLV